MTRAFKLMSAKAKNARVKERLHHPALHTALFNTVRKLTQLPRIEILLNYPICSFNESVSCDRDELEQDIESCDVSRTVFILRLLRSLSSSNGNCRRATLTLPPRRTSDGRVIRPSPISYPPPYDQGFLRAEYRIVPTLYRGSFRPIP